MPTSGGWDGITYVCPWQTRLRCLLAYGQMLSAAAADWARPGAGLPGAGLPGAGLPGAGLPGAGLPGAGADGDDDQVIAALARLDEESGLARPHILVSVWTVPLPWFVPFGPAERSLSLGPGRGRVPPRPLRRPPARWSTRRRWHGPAAGARGLFAVRNLQGQLARRIRRRSRAVPGGRRTGRRGPLARGLPPVLAGGTRLRRACPPWRATTRSARTSRRPRSAPPSTEPPGATPRARRGHVPARPRSLARVRRPRAGQLNARGPPLRQSARQPGWPAGWPAARSADGWFCRRRDGPRPGRRMAGLSSAGWPAARSADGWRSGRWSGRRGWPAGGRPISPDSIPNPP